MFELEKDFSWKVRQKRAKQMLTKEEASSCVGISRRTYSQTPLSHENIEKLQSIIDEINNDSDLSIKFVTDGKDSFSDFLKGYGVFKNVQSYFAMIGKSSDENVFEKQ